jgi:predicted esterase YcpF (UPF0227 family)
MLLYLHGFTSGPQSHKAQALGARMRERGLSDRFLSPQLPAAPAEAIALAEDLVARHGVTTVVGSSLGGYYSTWLAEKFEVPALAKPERFWLLVEEGDETLDYRDAVRRYAGARQTVLPGGDHSFTRWNDYLDPIIDHAELANAAGQPRPRGGSQGA